MSKQIVEFRTQILVRVLHVHTIHTVKIHEIRYSKTTDVCSTHTDPIHTYIKKRGISH